MARPQRGNRLQVAAILVAKGESVEEIFERDEADVLEIGGAARSDAFQKLQGRRKDLGGGHCTIMA